MNRLLLAAALAGPLALTAHAQGQGLQLPTREPAKPATEKPAAKPETEKPAADGPVATVNGVAIPAARAEAMIRERRQAGQPDNEQTRAMIREELINREILAQEANRAGIARRRDVQIELEMLRQSVLVQAYFRDFMQKNPASDAEIQREYDGIRKELGDREFRARHILVEREEEAQAIIQQLAKGAKFPELAQKLTRDEGTKERGGDLDWQPAATFVKPFADALAKMQKGETTKTPVRTQFGFHVIFLEDVRPAKHPPLAEVRAQLTQRVQRQKIEAHVRALREKAKVE